MDYPRIEPKPLNGDEAIRNAVGQPVAPLVAYWSWAHSNLIDNAERGAFAEFLVHLALGETSPMRVNWDRYDIVSPEGVRVEVKASGYVQSWAQEKPSAIQFSIRPTYGWNSETNTFAEILSRQADVYVFCLLAHRDQTTIDPLDTSQWIFYVLPTAVLDARVGGQKTIGLSNVIKLGALETDFTGLREVVLAAAGKKGEHCSVFGALHTYADEKKMALEDDAFAEAMMEKHSTNEKI